MNMRAKKVVKIIAIVLLISLVFIILGGIIGVFIITKDINLGKNELFVSARASSFYSVTGEELKLPAEYKITVPIEEISPYIVHAFVALEDKRFYVHHGLDYKRIAGALVNNIKAGYLKEGGSTITQQLAKNAILSNEKSIVRKLKEAKLAKQIEKRYSKDEIMEMYLNTIYFGHSLYGIRAATERLFGKKPSEVTLSEAAILAGIVKNPKKNSPLNSPENALKRRDLVLELMNEQGYIDENEYELALKEGYTEPSPRAESSSYLLKYAESAAEEAAKLLGISEKALLTGGYTVTTYFADDVQKPVSAARKIKNLKVNGSSSVIICDNLTGGILAYDSDVSYSPTEFRRSPGSTLKPFLSYLPALERGYSPYSPVLDEKTDFDGYSPGNYRNYYSGWSSLNDAVMSSQNIPAVKLCHETGVEEAKVFAERFGLKFHIKDALPAVLGGMTEGVTYLELLGAYSALARGGLYTEPTFIKSIEKDGELLYSHKPEARRIVSEESAYLMTYMLENTAKSGTAKKLSKLHPIAAKTGTTGTEKGNSDAWCAAYTPDYSVITHYFGALNVEVTGGGLPTMLTAKIFEKLPASESSFSAPDGIIYADIDEYLYKTEHVLKLAGESTPFEYRKSAIFSEQNLPANSDYFDNALPTDFSLKRGDGELIVSFTADDRFYISVRDLQGTEIYRAAPRQNFVELAVPEYGFGVIGYTLSAYTSDGVLVAESNPKIAFIFNSAGNSRHRKFHSFFGKNAKQ